MIRVLLVDDQQLVRVGLRRILELDGACTVVGECADGDEVADAVGRWRPDVVVMDVRMQRVDGAEATRRLGGIGFFLRADRTIWVFGRGRPLLMRRTSTTCAVRSNAVPISSEIRPLRRSGVALLCGRR